VGGSALEEHTIDGRACVQSVPGAEFQLYIKYHGSSGCFMYDVRVDGVDTSGAWHSFDASCVTSRAQRKGRPKIENVIKGWEKNEGGQCATRAFVFEKARAGGVENDEGRPGAHVDWSLGHITVRAFPAELYTVKTTRHRSSKSGTSQREALTEETLVKSGLTTRAGEGTVSFSSSGQRRPGDRRLQCVKGAPAVATLRLHYRDSFFMLLREDECCHGACARRHAAEAAAEAAAEVAAGPAAEVRPSRAAQMRSIAAAEASSGPSARDAIRSLLVGRAEARERVSRKRPLPGWSRSSGECLASSIDLTVSDDEQHEDSARPSAARGTVGAKLEHPDGEPQGQPSGPLEVD
jgi:hypothetical protein